MDKRYDTLSLLKIEVEKIDFEQTKVFGDQATGLFYPIPRDTKVVSKLFECLVDPVVEAFCQRHGLNLKVGTQTKYPDYSLSGDFLGTPPRKWVALDIKSTYFVTEEVVRGLTLGSYQGGLRDPASTRHTVLPYDAYIEHFCLCILYHRPPIDDQRIVSDVEVILQQKYKIATDKLGSHNTKNIGSVKNVTDLRNGTGPFSELGSSVFEAYWRAYPECKSLSDFQILTE